MGKNKMIKMVIIFNDKMVKQRLDMMSILIFLVLLNKFVMWNQMELMLDLVCKIQIDLDKVWKIMIYNVCLEME